MELISIGRIEDMFWHKHAYERRVVSNVESKLEMMLASLDKELCAEQLPADFRTRIDTIYQEVMGE
jgi:hypothetical protein